EGGGEAEGAHGTVSRSGETAIFGHDPPPRNRSLPPGGYDRRMAQASRETGDAVPGTGIRIGVDLGGTKIEAIALDRAGRARFRQRVPTPQGDYDATLRTIVALVGDAERALGERASVGVGTPGSISRASGRLRGANSVCLNGRPIREDLAVRLDREVRVT